MQVRLARPGDIETMFAIRTSVKENYQSRQEIAELGITPESVREMLAVDCRAWIAELGDRPIGFSIANATEETILGIFVRPTAEGQGAGRLLMQEAERWLWKGGSTEIWLLTGNDPRLRAYGFYCHLGWEPIGVETTGPFAGEMKFVKRKPG